MANVNVKIGFSGAKTFQSETQSLTKSVRGMNAELKQAAAEFQKDQTSVEKVRRVRDLLTKEVDKQRATYEQLQAQLQQTAAETGNESKETQRLEKQVAKAKSVLDGLQGTLSNLPSDMQVTGAAIKKMGEDIKSAGEKIKGFGKGIEDIGKGMTTAITGPILAIGGASIAAAKELDEGYDAIITKTGATGEAAEEMARTMDAIFTSIPVSAESAGIAIGDVNTRFGLLGDELETTSETFLMFSEIAGADLSGAINDTASIMTRFGVDTKDADSVLGLFAATSQQTGVDINTLIRSLDTSGATFKEMGLGLEESTVLLGQFERNGIDTTAALAGLRKAQQNAAKDGKSLDEALNEQIEAIKNAGTQTEALQIAQELFGRKGAAEMTQAIREGKFSLDDLSVSLDSYATTVADTYNATLDPWDQMTLSMNNLKVAGSELFGVVAESLMPIFQDVTAKVQELTETFRGMDDEQKLQIVQIAAIVAAIGPALLVVGKVVGLVGSVVSGIGSLVSVIGGAITSIGGITGATIAAAAPIVAIVAAIAAVVAAVVHLWNTNEGFRDAVMALVNDIKAFIEEKLTAIREFWNAHGEDIMAIVSGAWEFISGLIGSVLQIIMGIIRAAMKVLNGDWRGAWQTIKETFVGVWNTMVTAIRRAKEKMGDAVQKIVEAIKKKIDDMISGALSWGADLMASFGKGISDAMSKVTQPISDVIGWISDHLHFSEPDKGPLSNFHTWAPDMMKQFAAGIRAYTPEVAAAVNEVATDISVLQPGGASPDEIYGAVRSGASDAQVRLYIGERELGRVLRDMGVQFA